MSAATAGRRSYPTTTWWPRSRFSRATSRPSSVPPACRCKRSRRRAAPSSTAPPTTICVPQARRQRSLAELCRPGKARERLPVPRLQSVGPDPHPRHGFQQEPGQGVLLRRLRAGAPEGGPGCVPGRHPHPPAAAGPLRRLPRWRPPGSTDHGEHPEWLSRRGQPRSEQRPSSLHRSDRPEAHQHLPAAQLQRPEQPLQLRERQPRRRRTATSSSSASTTASRRPPKPTSASPGTTTRASTAAASGVTPPTWSCPVP